MFINDNTPKSKAISLFMNANRLHRNAFERLVQNSELAVHHSQNRILMFLSMNDTLKSQKEIAAGFDISSAAVAVSLKKLEADGYITKQVGKDNRYNEISITSKGKQVVESTRSVFQQIDNCMFDSFSDKELLTLNSFLERINSNLSKIDRK